METYVDMSGAFIEFSLHSHLPTARRLTWEDERVSGPLLNVKIDGDQSFQTNAEKWA
jgi:hypothetical protein